MMPASSDESPKYNLHGVKCIRGFRQFYRKAPDPETPAKSDEQQGRIDGLTFRPVLEGIPCRRPPAAIAGGASPAVLRQRRRLLGRPDLTRCAVASRFFPGRILASCAACC
jgi:hypothetical protein